jgi:hypothetical protein
MVEETNERPTRNTNPDVAHSHEELGNQLGLSRQRIQQIEARAFEKIRALVFGTDAFPLLAQTFASRLHLLERDYLSQEATKRAEREKQRRKRAKQTRTRRGDVSV